MTTELHPIAEGFWNAKDSSGTWQKVKVIVNQPMPDADDWKCVIVIFWPQSPPIVRTAYGVDSIQALELGVGLLAKERNMFTEKLGTSFYPGCQLPADLA